MVLYTGSRPYIYSMDIADLFVAKGEWGKSLLVGPYPRVDLHQVPDDIMYQHRWSGLLEMVLKHIKIRDARTLVQNILQPFLAYLHQEPQTDNYISSVLKYIVNQTEIVGCHDFIDTIHTYLPAEEENTVVTLAQHWKQEGIEFGMQQGMQQGVHQGKEEMLHTIAKRMHQNGFSTQDILKSTGLPIAELQTLLAEGQTTHL